MLSVTAMDYLSRLKNVSLIKPEKDESIVDVSGLPRSLSARYPLYTCIRIQVPDTTSIRSNNSLTIDLKKLKIKNIFTKPKITNEARLIVKNSGSLSISSRSGETREFGVFCDEKKSVMFGNKFVKGLKYEKFWDKRHVNVLYESFNMEEKEEVKYFIKFCLSNGISPVIVYNNEIKLKNLSRDDYHDKYFNNLLDVVTIIHDLNQNCSECILLIEPGLFRIDTLENVHIKKFIQAYSDVSREVKKLNIHVSYNVDFTCVKKIIDINTNRDLKLKRLLFLAEYMGGMYSSIGIKDSYMAFNHNPTDSYNYGVKFNNDMWIDYIFFINKFLSTIKCKGILYDIPVGRLNGCLDISRDTNRRYPDHSNKHCDYEDGSVVFFFGGSFNKNINTFYLENRWGKSLTIYDDKVVFKDHIDLCVKSGITHILFGGKKCGSTTSNFSPHSIGRCGDRYYLIDKIREYNTSH